MKLKIIIVHVVIIIGMLLSNNVNARTKKVSSHVMNGIGSWYGYSSGPRYKHHPKTANGEVFNPNKLTAAHKTLPFGTRVKVTNVKTNQSVIVTINDRGPYVRRRVIDLTERAAKSIGMSGIAKVNLNIVG